MTDQPARDEIDVIARIIHRGHCANGCSGEPFILDREIAGWVLASVQARAETLAQELKTLADNIAEDIREDGQFPQHESAWVILVDTVIPRIRGLFNEGNGK